MAKKSNVTRLKFRNRQGAPHNANTNRPSFDEQKIQWAAPMTPEDLDYESLLVFIEDVEGENKVKAFAKQTYDALNEDTLDGIQGDLKRQKNTEKALSHEQDRLDKAVGQTDLKETRAASKASIVQTVNDLYAGDKILCLLSAAVLPVLAAVGGVSVMAAAIESVPVFKEDPSKARVLVALPIACSFLLKSIIGLLPNDRPKMWAIWIVSMFAVTAILSWGAALRELYAAGTVDFSAIANMFSEDGLGADANAIATPDTSRLLLSQLAIEITAMTLIFAYLDKIFSRSMPSAKLDDEERKTRQRIADEHRKNVLAPAVSMLRALRVHYSKHDAARDSYATEQCGRFLRLRRLLKKSA